MLTVAYDLDDKITGYLADKGLPNARLADTVIIIPFGDGEIHRRISGVVTKEKLDAIVSEVKAKLENAA